MSTLSRQVRRAVPVRIKQRFGRGPAPVPVSVDTPCFAPFSNMYLFTNGDVRACCVNDLYPLGNITEARLPEIWGGARQAVLRDKIVGHDFSAGCDFCSWEIEGGMTPYAHVYDHLREEAGPTRADGVPEYPRRIEFNLSNSCNLECKMCAGELSSSIRIHREKLPPLPKVWDDQFFEDLRDFIPHLAEASFAGGEPFLGAENFRAWDLMAELNPGLRVLITTNGTQWNKRVERVLETLEVWPHISLDAHTKETFEYIREKADHDVIMANLDRLQAYAEERGTEARIMHCLMPQNHHELCDLLLFAEDRNLPVTITVVTFPVDFAIERMDRAELEQVHALFVRQYDRYGDRLVRNGAAFRDQITRIENWLAAERAPHRADAPPAAARIMEFVRQGEGPTDEGPAREVLEAYGPDAWDNVVTVDVDGTVVSCSPGAAEALGRSVDELVGGRTDDLLAAVTSRHGDPVDEQTTVDTDLIDRRITWPDAEFRVVIQPVRDASGWADEAAIRFAVRPTA